MGPLSSGSAAYHFGSDQRNSRHWLAYRWWEPVANDPLRKSATRITAAIDLSGVVRLDHSVPKLRPHFGFQAADARSAERKGVGAREEFHVRS
jgi:hypothetical protein